LTFIVCLKSDVEATIGEPERLLWEQNDSPDAMVGDVNLFLNDFDDEDVSTETAAHTPVRLIGEINLMIARREVRRMGLGKSALCTFLSYVRANRDAVVKELESAKGAKCELVGYQAKIDKENEASIKLFESIGFKKAKDEPNYFGEVEMVLMFGEQDQPDWRTYTVHSYVQVDVEGD
jgi:RimJ/RimL family protein N-acetyltransferase